MRAGRMPGGYWMDVAASQGAPRSCKRQEGPPPQPWDTCMADSWSPGQNEDEFGLFLRQLWDLLWPPQGAAQRGPGAQSRGALEPPSVSAQALGVTTAVYHHCAVSHSWPAPTRCPLWGVVQMAEWCPHIPRKMGPTEPADDTVSGNGVCADGTECGV